MKEHKPDLKGATPGGEAKVRRVAFALYFIPEVGKAWLVAGCLFSLEHSHTHPFMHCLAAFEL